jgi:hypothetical protein
MPLELPAELTADIPPETLSHPSIQKYNSLGDFVKGHLELDSYRGRSIALPNGEAKPEDFDKWAGEQSAKLKDKGYQIAKIGEPVPSDPQGYQFKIEGVDDQAIAGDKVLNSFKPVAHKLGITNTQAQALLDWFQKEAAPVMMVPQREYVTGDGVKELFKADMEKNQQFVEDYNRVVNHLQITDPDVKDLLNETISWGKDKEIALGDHPALVRILARAAPLLMQDFGGATQGGPASPEQASLVKEANDIINNPDNPKHKLYLAGDRGTHDYLQSLFAKAYPNKVTL